MHWFMGRFALSLLAVIALTACSKTPVAKQLTDSAVRDAAASDVLVRDTAAGDSAASDVNSDVSDAAHETAGDSGPSAVVLYSNCWSGGGSCSGAGSNNGWVRTVESSGCYAGQCLKLQASLNTNNNLRYGAGSTAIGASIGSHDALTVVYRVKFNKASDSIAGGNIKGIRPYYGPSGYLFAVVDVNNLVSPSGPIESAHDDLLMDVEPVVDMVRTLYYPAYCQLLSESTYQCPTRLKFSFTVNGDKNFGTKWREVRHYIKMPTTETSADGEWRFWVDGVPVLHAYNVDRKDGETDHFQRVTFYPSSEATEAFEHWMDEMVIYEGLVAP